MDCPQCSGDISQRTSYCPDCGLDIDTHRERLRESVCPDCEIEVDRSYCPDCGLDIETLRRELTAEGPDDSGASGATDGESERSAGNAREEPAADPQATGSRERDRQAAGTATDRRAPGSTADDRQASGQSAPHSGGQRASAEPRDTGGTKTGGTKLGAREVYCIGCGAIINEQAEMCPDCGMNQEPPGGWESDTGTETTSSTANGGMDPNMYKYQNLAHKSKGGNILLALIVPPLAYVNIGKPLMAVLNFFTVNFLLLGYIIVPIHVSRTITTARKHVRRR